MTSELFSFFHVAIVIITVAVFGLFSSIISTGCRTSQSSSEFEDKALAFPFLSYADDAYLRQVLPTYLQVQCLLYLHCSDSSVTQYSLLPEQTSKEHADCKPNAVNEHRITLKGKSVGVGREEDMFLFKAAYVPKALSQVLYLA